MKYLILFAFLCVGCVSNGQSFDEDKLLERVKELSSDAYEGRRTGEAGAAKARAYIVEQFEKHSIPSFGKSYEHAFEFEARGKTYKAVNVLAKIKGSKFPDKYIVVSAHYDHEGVKNGNIYNGADDDASGISALFAFAEYLTANPPRYTVILAAFDAEELGLQGAKYFVDKMQGADIVVNLNMDMISRSEKNELYVVGGRYTNALEKVVAKTQKEDLELDLLVGHDGSDSKQDWTYSSDHGPFHKVNIPFLYFGNEDHAGYHRPTDDFEKITPEFYKNAVRTILKIFVGIDALEQL